MPDLDGSCEERIAAQRDLKDAQAGLLMRKRVLALSSPIGKRNIVAEALALTRSDILKN